MTLKRFDFYWVLFLCFWLLWLGVLFIGNRESKTFQDAELVPPSCDTVIIKDLNYSLVKSDDKVVKSQLLGYRSSEIEVSSMQRLLSILSEYKNLDDLKRKISDIHTRDIEINRLLDDLENQFKPAFSGSVKAKFHYISKKQSTNKAKRIQEAESKLGALQIGYSKRKVTLEELKKAVAEIKILKTLPEYQEVKVKVREKQLGPKKSLQVNDMPSIQMQEMIFGLSTKAQDWLSQNEIISPVSGTFVKDLKHGDQAFISVQTEGFRLTFEDIRLRTDSVLVAVLCEGNQDSTTAIAVKNQQGKFIIQPQEVFINDCLAKNNKKARIQYKVPGHSILQNICLSLKNYK